MGVGPRVPVTGQELRGMDLVPGNFPAFPPWGGGAVATGEGTAFSPGPASWPLEGPGLHTWTIESNSLEDICGDIHLKKILDDTSAYQNVRCHHMEKVSIHSKNSELY